MPTKSDGKAPLCGAFLVIGGCYRDRVGADPGDAGAGLLIDLGQNPTRWLPESMRRKATLPT